MNILKRFFKRIQEKRQEQRDFYEFMHRNLIIDYGCGAAVYLIVERIHGDYEKYGILNFNINSDFYLCTYSFSFYWNKIKFLCNGYNAKSIIKKYNIPADLHDDYWVNSLDLYYNGVKITDIIKKRNIVKIFVESINIEQSNIITDTNTYIDNLIATNLHKVKDNA